MCIFLTVCVFFFFVCFGSLVMFLGLCFVAIFHSQKLVFTVNKPLNTCYGYFSSLLNVSVLILVKDERCLDFSQETA